MASITNSSADTKKIVVRKTAAESVTSSIALQNDDHLSFAIGVNEVWTFSILAPYTCSAAGQIRVAITIPAGATMDLSANALGNVTPAHGNTQTGGTAIQLDTTTGTSASLLASGTVVNSTTAGTVQFQWAQNASSGTSTTLLINGYLVANRI